MPAASSNRLALVLCLVSSVAASACGSSTRARGEEDVAGLPSAKASASAAPAVSEEPPVPEGSMSRGRVDQVLLRGPGWLLRQVGIDDVIRANKFVGWRVDRLPTNWDHAGIQPGDIVLKVNGSSLENQDDLWDAFLKLTEATELRISYERDGKVAEAIIPIVGAPDPETRKQLDANFTSPQRPATVRDTPNRQGTKTIIITGDRRDPEDE
ncbi:MAG: PDZ domain-containing protein [Polyangiaceae bacterium]